MILIGAAIVVVILWICGVLIFRNKKEPLSRQDKRIAWIFFGGPFMADLFFRRQLTIRELVGWGIFVLVVLLGLAFQHATCLGIGRGQSCT
jgi:uncharacterized membrane protein YdcZ (DUF606 family)